MRGSSADGRAILPLFRPGSAKSSLASRLPVEQGEYAPRSFRMPVAFGPAGSLQGCLNKNISQLSEKIRAIKNLCQKKLFAYSLSSGRCMPAAVHKKHYEADNTAADLMRFPQNSLE